MTDFTDLLKLVGKYKKQAAELDAKVRKEAQEVFHNSLHSFAGHIAQVIKSNPQASLDSIMSRIDVQEHLSDSLNDAKNEIMEKVQVAFAEGAAIGRAQIEDELKTLGLEADYPEINNSQYLLSLVADIDKNFSTLQTALNMKLHEIFSEPEQEFEKGQNAPYETAKDRSQKAVAAITKLTAMMSSRAAASASVAVNRGYTEQQLAAYSALAKAYPNLVIKKVWTANFTNNTPCPTCAALHGTAISITEVFVEKQSFGLNPPKIYQDLQGPPRHPNCKCRLTIHVDLGNAPKKDTPAGMRDYAKERAKELDVSHGFSSQQIRDMPDWQYKRFVSSVLNKFKKWFSEKG